MSAIKRYTLCICLLKFLMGKMGQQQLMCRMQVCISSRKENVVVLDADVSMLCGVAVAASMCVHIFDVLYARNTPKGIWRNGSASDSRSEGWEFESLCPHVL